MVATKNSRAPLTGPPFFAEGAITFNRFVKKGSANDGILQATVDGAECIGVAPYDPLKSAYAQYDPVAPEVGGIVSVESGAAIVPGDAVKTDSSGRAIPATAMDGVIDSGATAVTSSAANGDILTLSGGARPEQVQGKALTAASAAGTMVEVALGGA